MLFIGDEITGIPCNTCRGEVIEFSVPNAIWNKVIRKEGKEHSNEYLCVWCFLEQVFSYIEAIL